MDRVASRGRRRRGSRWTKSGNRSIVALRLIGECVQRLGLVHERRDAENAILILPRIRLKAGTASEGSRSIVSAKKSSAKVAAARTGSPSGPGGPSLPPMTSRPAATASGNALPRGRNKPVSARQGSMSRRSALPMTRATVDAVNRLAQPFTRARLLHPSVQVHPEHPSADRRQEPAQPTSTTTLCSRVLAICEVPAYRPAVETAVTAVGKGLGQGRSNTGPSCLTPARVRRASTQDRRNQPPGRKA